MMVFSNAKGIEVWGPTASISVSIGSGSGSGGRRVGDSSVGSGISAAANPHSGFRSGSAGGGGLIGPGWVFTNFAIGAKDIVDVRQCFDDVSFIYALGNNQAQCAMSLTFAVFLGSKNCGGGDNTGSLASSLAAYEAQRISRHTEPVTVSIGKFSRMGWITGIDMGGVDAARCMCQGTIHLIMELKKQ